MVTHYLLGESEHDLQEVIELESSDPSKYRNDALAKIIPYILNPKSMFKLIVVICYHPVLLIISLPLFS